MWIRSTSTFVFLAFRLFPLLGIWESVKSGKVMFSAKGGMNFGFPWWYGGGKRDTIDLPSLVFVVCFRVLSFWFPDLMLVFVLYSSRSPISFNLRGDSVVFSFFVIRMRMECRCW
jgi:hypothetical protein